MLVTRILKVVGIAVMIFSIILMIGTAGASDTKALENDGNFMRQVVKCVVILIVGVLIFGAGYVVDMIYDYIDEVRARQYDDDDLEYIIEVPSKRK